MDEKELFTDLLLDCFSQLFLDEKQFSDTEEELLFKKEVLYEIPALVHIRDQKTGKIIWWNAEWRRKMSPGLKDKTIEEFNLFLKKCIHPDDLFLLKQSNEYYQHKEVPGFGGFIRFRFPGEDSWSWLLGISRIIRKDAEGVPLKTLAVFMDFTQAINTESVTQEAFREVLRRGNKELLKKITKREKEVIRLLIKGSNNKEIAQHLHISYHTVESHRKNIRAKLNVKNTSELISLAKDIGI